MRSFSTSASLGTVPVAVADVAGIAMALPRAGRSAKVICSRAPIANARSMTFSSSRTLPGNSYAVSAASASGVMPFTSRRNRRL